MPSEAAMSLNSEWHFTGTIRDIGTSSFYPPHHMTMGEGGAVYTDNPFKQDYPFLPRLGTRLSARPAAITSAVTDLTASGGELPLGYDHKMYTPILDII